MNFTHIKMLVFLLGSVMILPLNAQELKLLFAGDLMAHDVNLYQKDHHAIYRYIKPYLASHQLNFINVESVISDRIKPQGYPRFSAPSSYIQPAIDAGFNVFSLANNHSADHLHYGILESKQIWQELKVRYPWIQYSGIKEADQSPAFQLFYAGTMKVAFIALTQFLNWQDSSDIGADLIQVVDFRREEERKALLKMVTEAREQADVVILSYHGGEEYLRSIEEDKFTFFKELVDAGVHIIWAHHPHVLQPIVRYHDAIIINSNGNFISGQTWSIKSSDAHKERSFTGDSLLYSISVQKVQGEVEVHLIKSIPISNYRHPQDAMIVIDLEKIESYDFLTTAWKEFYHQRRKAIAPYQEVLLG